MSDLQEHRVLVEDIARKTGVAPALLHAVLLTESDGDPAAKGLDGERGLMQVRQATWEETVAYYMLDDSKFTWAKCLNPRLNVEIGARHLARLTHQFEERNVPRQPELIYAAYNMGLLNLQMHNFSPPETAAMRRFRDKYQEVVQWETIQP